jgi:receptor-type tyrosine-protein phosphatase Q
LYSAVDSTSLFISWQAPPLDQQNGIVRRYDLTLTELETGSVFSYSTSRTNFTATLLHPYYQYQVEISAVTVGSGPNSAPLIVMTPEDGMI